MSTDANATHPEIPDSVHHITPISSPNSSGHTPCALFLSGGGSNAEKLLLAQAADANCPYRVQALVTDRPGESRAAELAERFDLPLVANDIRAFYRAHGLTRVSLATAEGRAAREAWTAELLQALAPHEIAFGVFAGFVPMTNLCAEFPCINVHPGDLTVRVDGRRHLIGLHTIPIELAMLLGLDHLRSSVILATPYDQAAEDMDAGPILGLSPRVPLLPTSHSLEELRAMAAARPKRRPIGGYADALEALAAENQERLKVGGDWLVLPPVVADVALGRFGLDAEGRLYVRDSAAEPWTPVRTVCYGADGRRTRVAPGDSPQD